MDQTRFERLLDELVSNLTQEMRSTPNATWLKNSTSFEQHVRERLAQAVDELGPEGAAHKVDLHESGQQFPDIPCGRYGVEVKFTKDDSWVSIANSIRESRRVESVEIVYLLFGKLGGVSEARWMRYEECVVHVRTSHEPRYQVDMTGTKPSLFNIIGIEYDSFRRLDIMDKMPYIRKYARTVHPEGHLWWLEDTETGEEHTTPLEPVLYVDLDEAERTRLRAEATLLCPQVLKSGRSRDKYRDVVLYMLTYHGVLCHQARDLFSAGSVAGVRKSDGSGDPQMKKALLRLQGPMLDAAAYLDPALFHEYWGEDVAKDDRIRWWLEQADDLCRDWTPSECLFLDYQRAHGMRPAE